jgi:hypothetical protein
MLKSRDFENRTDLGIAALQYVKNYIDVMREVMSSDVYIN